MYARLCLVHLWRCDGWVSETIVAAGSREREHVALSGRRQAATWNRDYGFEGKIPPFPAQLETNYSVHSFATVLIVVTVRVTDEGARPSKESELVRNEGDVVPVTCTCCPR